MSAVRLGRVMVNQLDMRRHDNTEVIFCYDAA